MSNEPLPPASDEAPALIASEHEQKENEPKIFWSVLMERAISNRAVGALLNVATVAGARGYTKIELPYTRTDSARNMIVSAFLDNSEDPNDVLVMLDADHNHPSTILDIAHYPPEIGVVGALAYRRGGQHDPLFFLRGEDGLLHGAMTWEGEGLYRCAAVSTCAIAIKRWVFEELSDRAPYYFRYEYPDNGKPPTEDMVFARFCEEAGIHHYCDVTVTTPHLFTDEADGRQWREFLAARRAEIERFPAAPPREELPGLLTEMGLGVGAEIGVQKGEFSEHLLKNWPGKLYMIDAWEHQDNGYTDEANVSNEEHSANFAEAFGRVEPYLVDRAQMLEAYSTEAATLFEDGDLDFVYIDANHAYEAVLADLTAWWPKVRPGGLICGDDFVNNPHPKFECRVKDAVLEFTKDMDVEIHAEHVAWPRLWYFVKPE